MAKHPENENKNSLQNYMNMLLADEQIYSQENDLADLRPEGRPDPEKIRTALESGRKVYGFGKNGRIFSIRQDESGNTRIEEWNYADFAESAPFKRIENERMRNTRVSAENLKSLLKEARSAADHQTFDPVKLARLKVLEDCRKSGKSSTEAELNETAEKLAATRPYQLLQMAFAGQKPDLKMQEECLQAAVRGIAISEKSGTENDKRLKNNYLSLSEDKDPALLTSHAGFNALLKETVQADLRKVMLHRGFVFNEKNALVEGRVQGFTFSERRSLIEDLRSTGSTLISSAADNPSAQVRNDLCRSVLGTDYPEAQRVFGSLFGHAHKRNCAMFSMMSMLMNDGLTPEEILDPAKGTEKKKALGSRILKALGDAEKECPPDLNLSQKEEFIREKVRKISEEMLRANMDHAEELCRFVGEKYALLNTDDPASLKEYLRNIHSFQDGIWDMICQGQIHSDTLTTGKDECVRIYGHENETPDETIRRVNRIFNTVTTSALAFNAKLVSHRSKAEILNLMERQDWPSDGKGGYGYTRNQLNDLCSNLFKTEVSDIEITRLPVPDDPEKSDEHNMKVVSVIPNMAAKLKAHVFTSLSPKASFALCYLTPGIESRISLELNQETFRDASPDEILGSLMSGSDRIGKVTLHFDSGEDYVLSGNIWIDQPSKEDLNAIERLDSELSLRTVRAMNEGKDLRQKALSDELKHFYALESDPEKGLFSSMSSILGDITEPACELIDVLKSHEKAFRETGIREDPLSLIIVGDRTLQELTDKAIMRSAEKDRCTESDRRIMAAGILAVCLSEGIPVTHALTHNEFAPGTEPLFASIRKPAELDRPSAALSQKMAAFSAADPELNALSASFKNGTLRTEQAVQNAGRVMTGNFTRNYFIHNKSAQDIFPVNIKTAAENTDHIRTFRSCLASANESGRIMKFENGMHLSEESAIYAIVCAKAYTAAPEDKDKCLKYEDVLTEAGLRKDPRLALNFAEAKAEYIRILSLPAAEREREMRTAMMNCMRWSGERTSDVPSDLTSMDEMEKYVSENCVRLDFQKEILKFAELDSAPAGIGNEKAARLPLSGLLKNRPVVTQCDLEAMTHARLSESCLKITEGEDIDRNAGKAAAYLGAATAMSRLNKNGKTKLSMANVGNYQLYSNDVSARIMETMPALGKIHDGSSFTTVFKQIRELKDDGGSFYKKALTAPDKADVQAKAAPERENNRHIPQ